MSRRVLVLAASIFAIGLALLIGDGIGKLLRMQVSVVGAASRDRDPAQVRAFRALNPCPSTGKTTGPCPGWVVDHAYPFCAGGPDRPSNMRWQNYPDSLVKDRVEVDLCRVMSGAKRLGPLKVLP